jgi:hypothetical protein
MEWPADQIERRPIASLAPYKFNPRLHSPEQIKQLTGSRSLVVSSESEDRRALCANSVATRD